jgi:hypothetical protein
MRSPCGNPHPCHLRHKEVAGSIPDCDHFCQTYGVRWISTKDLCGRLEIEEALQDALGTNVRKFYEEWQKNEAVDVPAEKIMDNSSSEFSPCSDGDNSMCENLWTSLSMNPCYSQQNGVQISTMGGRAANLCVHYDSQTSCVRIWRSDGKPDFWMSRDQFRIICSRYMTGLLEGRLPAPAENGGTGYFTDPEWAQPELGRFNTPYAAALLRSVMNRNF